MRKGQKMSDESRAKLVASKACRREAGIRPRRFRRPVITNNDGTSSIILTRGFRATIDTPDEHLVIGWNWYADIRKHTVYAVRHNSDGSHSYLHHVILGSTDEVDHRDNDGLNNRRNNLRQCSSHSQNNANMRPRTNGFKGVERQSVNSWAARTKVNGQQVHIGNYPSAEKAARAYDDFMYERFGDYAQLNFSEKDQCD